MSFWIDLYVVSKDIFVAIFNSIFRFFFSPTRKCVVDEIVLITGSGNGMGRLLSIEFSKFGAVVVLCDINEEENRKTEKLIKDIGGKSLRVNCDVSDRNAVYKMKDDIIQKVGHVTMLINNAGIVTGKGLLECPDENIERVLNVCLLAQFWTVKCFLPDMLKKNHGHIVNMASTVGLIGLKNLTDYAASKFGVVGFTEVLQYELVFSGYDGVHTTLLCPSFTETGMFEGCRMKYPWLVAPLKTEESVERIMQGILTNQHQVYIPRIVYFFTFLKSIIPVKAMIAILKFSGADTFMDTFVGRQEKTKHIKHVNGGTRNGFHTHSNINE